VWRWLLQQSHRDGGRFQQLGSFPLCSVLSMAAAEGDNDSLRRFAGQLSEVWNQRGTVHERDMRDRSFGEAVLLAGMSAPDPFVFQRLLLELACGSDSASGSLTSGSPGWELLQIAARKSLHGAAFAAAKHGCQEALQAIVHAGQLITLLLVNTAASWPDVQLLRWLLSAGPLPAPEVHDRCLHLTDYSNCRRNGYPRTWYEAAQSGMLSAR
jgi:hypothetical protein